MTSRRRTGKPSQTTRAKCDNYVYGDVFEVTVWEVTCLSDAPIIVSLTPERERAEHIVDLETETPRIVRVDSIDLAERYLDEVSRESSIPTRLLLNVSQTTSGRNSRG